MNSNNSTEPQIIDEDVQNFETMMKNWMYACWSSMVNAHSPMHHHPTYENHTCNHFGDNRAFSTTVPSTSSAPLSIHHDHQTTTSSLPSSHISTMNAVCTYNSYNSFYDCESLPIQ